MPIKPAALLLICLLNAACTSNQYLVRPEVEVNSSPIKETVFVSNKDKTRQLSILQGSGIYNLSDSPQAANQLTLLHLNRDMVCGLPMLGAMIFLGLLPVSMETDHHFSYTLQEGSDVQTYIHDIRVKTRVSIWEWLAKPFTSSENEILTEGLALSTRRVATEMDFVWE